MPRGGKAQQKYGRLARGGLGLVLVCLGLGAFWRLDQFQPAEVLLFRRTEASPAQISDFEEQGCAQDGELTTCRALRLSHRSTQSGFGHAHSRVTYRLELLYFWTCPSGTQLRLNFRTPFLVEHVHADLFAHHIGDLSVQLPLRDVLWLRRAPATHQTNFLLDVRSSVPLEDVSNLISTETMERRAGPGYIALGYPEPDADAIARHLGCRNL